MKLLIENANNLLSEFVEKNDSDKWQTPFPMGVFGTLRKHRGNDYLMGVLEGENPQHEDSWHRTDIHYNKWCKAFLPHFYPSGLSLEHHTNKTAPFEIYFYDAKNWEKMIPSVERLEGFRPTNESHYGYHRTLVAMHVLPDDFKHPQWDSGERWERQELKIPIEDWDKYPTLPVWVYSSCRSNSSCQEIAGSPVIWTGLE